MQKFVFFYNNSIKTGNYVIKYDGFCRKKAISDSAPPFFLIFLDQKKGVCSSGSEVCPSDSGSQPLRQHNPAPPTEKSVKIKVQFLLKIFTNP